MTVLGELINTKDMFFFVFLFFFKCDDPTMSVIAEEKYARAHTLQE